MMKMYSMKNKLSLILCIVLIAAMALSFTGCGGNTAGEVTSFTVITTDLEGVETTFEVTTDKATVGEALLEEGIIEGHDAEYGLYVDAVNGIALDWDRDGKYWAVYVDGEYAMAGVDTLEVIAGATYTFKPE